MRWWYYIFIPEHFAAQLGFTHSGRIFGAPAWLHEDGDYVDACTKVLPLQLYVMGMYALCQAITMILMLDIEIPLVVQRPLVASPDV